jgi:phosphate transport system protein
MRTAFHEQLDALTRSIGEMCGLAGTAMQQARVPGLAGARIGLHHRADDDRVGIAHRAEQPAV